MDNMELNMNEMEQVAGGRMKGGSASPLPEKEGFTVYKIKSGDRLGKIAKKFHTTVDYLDSINPTIKNVNDITTGYYIYVPEV